MAQELPPGVRSARQAQVGETSRQLLCMFDASVNSGAATKKQGTGLRQPAKLLRIHQLLESRRSVDEI